MVLIHSQNKRTSTVDKNIVPVEVVEKIHNHTNFSRVLSTDTLNLKQVNIVQVEGELFCVEEVHPGSDRTSRSVAWNQVSRHK